MILELIYQGNNYTRLLNDMVIDVIALTRAFSAEAAVLLIEPRAQSGGHCHPVKIRQQKSEGANAENMVHGRVFS